mmetsp:Transcript_22190/g.71539  ORF Transcript_22190/g.71539 Transcript_22190/m.71539 type:complete len:228 (-) Transcript_22190:338-1021(-)
MDRLPAARGVVRRGARRESQRGALRGRRGDLRQLHGGAAAGVSEGAGHRRRAERSELVLPDGDAQNERADTRRRGSRRRPDGRRRQSYPRPRAHRRRREEPRQFPGGRRPSCGAADGAGGDPPAARRPRSPHAHDLGQGHERRKPRPGADGRQDGRPGLRVLGPRRHDGPPHARPRRSTGNRSRLPRATRLRTEALRWRHEPHRPSPRPRLPRPRNRRRSHSRSPRS